MRQNGFHFATHALSRKIDGVFGHGPAISIDDDAEIHERLLDVVWKVRAFRCARSDDRRSSGSAFGPSAT